MSSVYVSRINQLDADQLDTEIYRIFTSKSQEISRQLTPGITDKWTPEINAGLRTIIWIFSLGTGKSTFGQKLLDLTYVNLSRKKAIMFMLLSVIPKYLEDKYLDPNRLLMTKKDKLLKKYIEKLKNILSIISFMNLLVFLNRGIQSSLLERILGISSETVASYKPRTIGYSYMTRELLWHGLMELFTTGLPMVNFHQLKRAIQSLIFPKKNKEKKDKISPKIMTINTRCPYCNETPILPCHAGCQHIYCYYCMKAHFEATKVFDCLACGVELQSNYLKTYSVIPSTI